MYVRTLQINVQITIYFWIKNKTDRTFKKVTFLVSSPLNNVLIATRKLDILTFLNIYIFNVLSSMVTHTRNWCSAFNPSKCTHTAVSSEHTPGAVGRAVMLQRPGSSWGFGVLLKDTSVVVWKEERAVHSLPPPTIPAGPRLEPATFRLRVWLSNH